MPHVEKDHEVTHWACPNRIHKMGRLTVCCGCKPHADCGNGKSKKVKK